MRGFGEREKQSARVFFFLLCVFPGDFHPIPSVTVEAICRPARSEVFNCIEKNVENLLSISPKSLRVPSENPSTLSHLFQAHRRKTK